MDLRHNLQLSIGMNIKLGAFVSLPINLVNSNSYQFNFQRFECILSESVCIISLLGLPVAAQPASCLGYCLKIMTVERNHLISLPLCVRLCNNIVKELAQLQSHKPEYSQNILSSIPCGKISPKRIMHFLTNYIEIGFGKYGLSFVYCCRFHFQNL